MKIIGLGTDIVEVDRIKSALDRFGEDFCKRIFTPAELQCAAGKKFPITFFAGRWAAKEAAAKALGCGIGENCAFTEIEVLNGEGGKPELTFSGRAASLAAAMNVVDIKISLSHENNYAVATVILSGGEGKIQ